jgi:hypothetical protein
MQRMGKKKRKGKRTIERVRSLNVQRPHTARQAMSSPGVRSKTACRGEASDASSASMVSGVAEEKEEEKLSMVVAKMA